MARTMTVLIIDMPIDQMVFTVLPFDDGVHGHTAPKIPALKG